MRVLQTCRLEIDDALNKEVLGIFLGGRLLLDAVHKMIEHNIEQLLRIWIPEEAFEVEVVRSTQLNGVQLRLLDVSIRSTLEHVEEYLTLLDQREASRYRLLLQDGLHNFQERQLLGVVHHAFLVHDDLP